MENKVEKTSFWRVMAYCIIYSFIGFLIETLFALASYGVFESRQSFLYGPFCAIYGVGAACMIVSLKYFKKSDALLFIGGAIVGGIVEYLVSYFGELILNVRWWDYSNRFLNINGRICLLYSLFWGGLGLILIKVINPKIDRLIDFIKKKVNIKFLKSLTTFMTLFFIVNCIISGRAIFLYLVRQSVENNLDIENKEYAQRIYEKEYSNEKNRELINKFWGDEKMVITYPNLTITLKDKSTILVRDLLPGVRYYYYKFDRN